MPASNWRLLESEIETILRKEGFHLCTDEHGDKIIDYQAMATSIGSPIVDDRIPALNVTLFARELAERVEVKAQAVKVTR